MHAKARRTPRLRALALGVTLVCLALAACGGDGDAEAGGAVDLSELEAKLVEMQEAKSPKLSVEGATCPGDVELTQGSTFECIVTIEGVDAPYTVTLTDDNPEAESGSFHIEPARAIIDVSLVIEFIADQVPAEAQVECGSEKVIVSDVGGTFECTVATGDRVERVEMLVKDIEGTVVVNN